MKTKQGSSTGNAFLPGIHISLFSYIVDFRAVANAGLLAEDCHFDLSSKNGKTSGNAFQMLFAVWKFVTPPKKKQEQATFGDLKATFRDQKPTLRDQRF